MLRPQHTPNQFLTAIQSVLNGQTNFSEVSDILCPYLQTLKESRQSMANFSFSGAAIRKMKLRFKAQVQPALNQTYALLNYLNQHPTIVLQPNEIEALKAPFPWGDTPEQAKILKAFEQLHPIRPAAIILSQTLYTSSPYTLQPQPDATQDTSYQYQP